MAIGALEALRSEKLAGKIPVTGIDGIKAAVDAIRAKEFAATVSWDPFWQGGMGLAIAYGAKTGKFDPAKEPHLHREFYGAARFNRLERMCNPRCNHHQVTRAKLNGNPRVLIA